MGVNKTMRAGFFLGNRRMEAAEVPVPKPPEGWCC